jgi:hypothetical protein
MIRPNVLARAFAAGGAREPFRVVCADPPWPFNDKLPGAGRGAATQYPLLSDAIASRRFVGGELLDQVADDAYLFLWRVSAGGDPDLFTLVEYAYAVARAWGFAPKTEVIWRKQTKNGARHFGMGRQFRMEHEACIVATRGKPKPLVRNIRSVFDARRSTAPSPSRSTRTS